MIALLEAHRAGLFKSGHRLNNLVAGVVVGVVALPLAMAFAIASGAKPEQGIYTAIVAGLLTSLFGGSRLQISGPTGAFIVILAGITANHGIGGLQVATLMAGLILIGMGAAKFGAVIKFIPQPVIIGFTTGIAVIIWVGQWKDFFGLQPLAGAEHFHQKLASLLVVLPHLHLATTALGLFALLILILSPKVLPRVPGPLVALVLVTGVQAVFDFSGVATLGTAYGGIPRSLPTFDLPDISGADIVKLIGPAFTIALLGAIESLLSAVVADGMAGTRHDSNQELIGQGIANVVSPLFGGFAATGAIARTATNIRNGATSPLAGVVHSGVLVLVVLIFAPLAAYIPLCVLAAILFVVAWNMSELHHFLHLARTAPRSDVVILLITFALTVVVDLVVAVNVGVVLASLLFMRRMAQSVEVSEESHDLDESEAADGTRGRTLIYSIDGPFFFGAAEKLQSTLSSIHQSVDTVVLRMGRVPFADATGIQTLAELIEDFQRGHAKVVLCEVRPNLLHKLERSGVLDKVGRDNVHGRLADWRAKQDALPLSAAPNSTQ